MDYGTGSGSGAMMGTLNRDAVNEQPLLDNATGGVREAITRVENVLTIAIGVADSVFGATPATSGGLGGITGGTLKASARGDELRYAIKDLHSALGRLESEVQRLRAI